MYSAVLLAGRESSRFWPLNQRHKSLFYLMGKPIIWWNLKGIEKAGIRKVIVVQSLKRDVEEELKKFKFQKLKIKYLFQKSFRHGKCSLASKRFFRKEIFSIERRHFGFRINPQRDAQGSKKIKSSVSWSKNKNSLALWNNKTERKESSRNCGKTQRGKGTFRNKSGWSLLFRKIFF